MNKSTSCYEQYRDKLQLVSQTDWQTRVIEAFAETWPEWDASTVWKKCYGRFDPDSEPYISLLLQQGDCSRNMCLVEVFSKKPEQQNNTQDYPDKQLGWIRGRHFPNDPKLAHLTMVLDIKQDVEILRYRPSKRCAFSAYSEQTAGKVFGKQFADNRGALIYAENQRLWNAACEERLNFTVAKPIRWDIKTQTLWHHAIEGQPLVEKLFSADGTNIARRIGTAAGGMTQSGIEPVLGFDGQAQLQRTTKYANELVKRVPGLTSNLSNILQILRVFHARHTTRLRPLHGAPHAHRWLECGDRLGLVDFDRTCMGEPELDAATFIAEMDFEDRDKVPVDELNATFLDAYQDIAGKLDQRLLAAYRCHKRLAKALKAARSLRVNGDRKARKHVAYANQALRDVLL